MNKHLLSVSGRTIEEIIAAKLCVSISDVTPEATISNDLGADSLDSVELCMNLEQEFQIVIDDEKWENCKTVSDVVKLVREIHFGNEE